MCRRPWSEVDAQRGSATLSTVAALGLLLTFVVLLLQFSVWQYGRGVLRSAALEAARAGAVLDAPSGVCERRFETIQSALLSGRLGDGVEEARCELTDELVTVSVDARFERWLPISPDWSFTVTATAVREVAPE